MALISFAVVNVGLVYINPNMVSAVLPRNNITEATISMASGEDYRVLGTPQSVAIKIGEALDNGTGK